MRQRSDIWVRLAQGDFNLETKAWIGDKVYTEITAPKIKRSLMSGPLSVGNCTSATLDLSILTDDVLDAKVPIIIKGRLTNGETVSEWLPFGTFYINQKSSYKGLWTVSCYDAMLKANQSYLSADDNSAGWPKTMADVVAEIAYRIGVSVDPRTIINTGDDYTVPYPTGLTMLQVLGYIGGCHGGNWIISEDNALRLVPLVNAPSGVALVNETSGHVTPESVIPNNSYYITDDAGRPLVTVDGFYLVWAEDGYVSAVDGLATVNAVLGSMDIGTTVKISGVSMSNSASAFTAGDTGGVGVIKVESNPYATQSICDALHEKFAGFVYAPYTASKAIYDPAAELGDQVVIGNQVSSVLYSSSLNMDIGFVADISAPNSEELSAEYPYLTDFKKLYQTTTALNESIEVTAKLLYEKVEDSDANVDELSKALADEVKRASDVEQDLNERIGAEAKRAQEAEKALSDDFALEKKRAEDAETALQNALDNLADVDIANMGEQLESLQKNMQESGESYNSEIAWLKAKEEAQDTIISGLSEKNTTLESEVSSLNTKVGDYDSDIAGLKEQTQTLSSDVTTLKTKDASHDTAIAELEQEVLYPSNLVNALQTRLSQDEEAIADLTARLDALAGNT